LEIAPGRKVLFAGLSLGMSTEPRDGDGRPAPAGRDPARAVLVGPDGVAHQLQARPDDGLRIGGGTGPGGVQAFVEVTALVSGGGTYTVGNVAASTGRGSFGGWSLTVVYADRSLPVRVAAVLTGDLATPSEGTATVASGLVAGGPVDLAVT